MGSLVLNLVSTILVLSVFGLHEALADQATIDCPDGWIPLHRGCYKFFGKSRRERRSWQDADTTCRGMDGELHNMQSKNEKIPMIQYLEKNFPKKKFWVNLVKTDGKWKWEGKSDVDEILTPWSSASLRDRRGTPCGAVSMSKDKGLKLTNDKCSKKQAFICEFHKINARTSTISLLSEQTTGSSLQEGDVQHSTTGGTTKQSIPTIPVPKTTKTSTIKEKGNTMVKSVQTDPTTQSEHLWATERAVVTPKIEMTDPTAEAYTTNVSPRRKTTMNSEVIEKASSRVTRSTVGVSYLSSTISTSDDNNEPEYETEKETETSSVAETHSVGTHHLTKSTPLVDFSKGPLSTIRHLTSPVIIPSVETPDDSVDDVEDGEDDDGVEIEELIQGAKDIFKKTSLPRIPTRVHPRNQRTTTPRVKVLFERGFSYWVEAMEEFEGCYIPGMRGAVRQMVVTARNLYRDGADYCPQVTASRLTFPRTEAGKTAMVPCRRGTGFATLHCGDDTVCWEDQPDLSGCASPKLKALLEKFKEEQIEKMVSPSPEKETEVVEQSVNMTSELVAMTEDDDLSVEDIMVTSEVLTAFSHSTEDSKVKVRNKKDVKKIVGNVVKAGNNLMSKKKKKLWKKMRRGEKIRSASSLMTAMETATLSMADSIDEPAVIRQVEENIEVEIQVVDVERLEEEDKEEIVYDSQQSDASFSIPLENLKTDNDSKLDKVVFITHYSMAEFLDGGDYDDDDDDTDDATDGQGGSLDENRKDDQNTFIQTANEETVVEEEQEAEEEEEPAPQIASHILSATIGSGGGGHKIKLQKPVTFTMKHTMEVHKEDRRLCSFWDISQGGSQGFWSQEGCQVKKSNGSHTTCECDHMTSFAILIDVHGFETPEVHQIVLRLITIIGCVLSCLCLLISWFTFQFCTALQGERNSIHKNLAACLFVAELLFVAGVTHTEPKMTCSVVAVFLHFFFLSAFTWMFLEGLHIIFMLVQVFDASRSRLPYYYLVGYGFPAVVVGISCIVYFPGYGTDEFCWLTTDRYFIWAFAGPVALILVVNAIFLTYAMTTVCRHSDYVFNAKDRGAGSPIRSWIQGALALEVLLGLTWTFGYFLLDANTLPLAYAFTVLNSLQGMFIFIFHCLLNKKAQKEYSRVLRVPLGGMSSIFASTHSTAGKRTNASSKGQEMTHSTSNGRKTSLHYKPSNGSQHNNYFNDKCNQQRDQHKNNYLDDKYQHDNRVNDRYSYEKQNGDFPHENGGFHQNGDVFKKHETNDDDDGDNNKMLYNNNGDLQHDKDNNVIMDDDDGVIDVGSSIITMD